MAAGGGSLAAALVAFQAEAPKIALDSTNPHFKNRYASLAGIMEAVRPPLTKNGLAIVQQPTVLESGMPALRTTLLHSSGETLSDVMPLAVDKPGPQALGSAITYARRYSALAILGLVGDEDDDANSAQPKQKQKASAPAAADSPFKAPTNTGNGDDPERLANVVRALIDAGAITADQLERADKKNLLARLESLAKNKGIEVPA